MAWRRWQMIRFLWSGFKRTQRRIVCVAALRMHDFHWLISSILLFTIHKNQCAIVDELIYIKIEYEINIHMWQLGTKNDDAPITL